MSAGAREPFGAALRRLLDERRMSIRQLSAATRETDPEGRGLTHSYLSQAASGKAKLTANAIVKVAAALDIPPGYFAEYRGAAVRDEFDPDAVGFERMLANVDEITALVELPDTAKLHLHRTLIHTLRAERSPTDPGLQRFAERLSSEAEDRSEAEVGSEEAASSSTQGNTQP